MFNNEQNFSLKEFFAPLTTKKAILIIAVLGFIVFGNALFNGFVLDDRFQIVNLSNRVSIQKIPTFFFVRHAGYVSDVGYYRPIFFSFLTIMYSLFGLNSFFYHSFQLIIHIGNISLIFLLFKKFFTKGLSLFLSILFLAHPMNVEAVSYISAVADPLAVFFGLLALHIMIKDKLHILSIIIASGLMLLSLLTKEAGFPILVIILSYCLFFKKKNILAISLFTCITLGLYFFLRLGVTHEFFQSDKFAPITQISFSQRMMNVPKIIFFYIFTFFIPLKLRVAQYWIVEAINLQDFLLPLMFDILFFIALIFLWVFLYKKNRKTLPSYLFFLCWFFIGLGLYLQFIALDMTVAERWFYLPMIGLLGLIGVIVHYLKLDSKKNYLILFLAVLVIIILSLRTMVRNADWFNGATLNSHDGIDIALNEYSTAS